MKRFLYLLLLVSFNLQAQIPQTLSYQGLLTTSTGPNAGLPIADGSYSVTFNFYTDPTTATKIDFRTINVTTFQGLFATVIGNGVAPNQPLNLNPPLGSTQYYVGLQVNGEAELLPRVALTAVPYAFTANTAYSLASSATIAGSQLNGQITNSSVTIPFAQITGSLASTQIPTGSITNEKLASGIDAAKIVGLPPATIADGSVTDAKLIGVSASKVTGTLATAQYGDASITNEKLASGIDAAKIVGLPPATIADGSVTDAKLIGISASKVTGTLTTTQYGDGSITNEKLASGIDASKIVGLPPATIADGSVTNIKLATDIDASKLTQGNLSVDRLANNSITNDKLATGIDASKIVGLPPATIADGSVTDAKLIGISASKVTGTLTTTQYGDASITNEKLASGIDASKIVGLPPATIADGSVTDAKLIGISASKVTGTLTTTQYGDGSITNEKLASGIDASKIVGLPPATIADGSVTNIKLATDIDASKLTQGNLSVDRLANNSITNDKLATGIDASKIVGLPPATIADGAVTNIKLASDIDASKLTQGTFSVDRLADGSISDAKLIGISASKLTGTLTTTQYGDGSITNEKLASGIDASKIVGLPPATIADGSVTNIKLATDIDASKLTQGNLSVDRLANNSITNDKLATGIDASKIVGLPPATIADGAVTNIKLASDIDASKLTQGTLSVDRLADGSISDAKLTGIIASKITGTLSAAQIGSGTIDNSKLASDIDASKLTAGTIPVSRLGVILPAGPVSSRPASAAEGTLRYNSDDKKMEYYNGVNWYYTTPKIAVVKDAPSSGSNGGGSISGWQIRNLNLKEGDDSFLSLSSNQFTLSPGEYVIEASSPGVGSDIMRVALVNATNLSEAYYGTSEFNASANGSQSSSFLKAFRTLTASTSYEIRFYVQNSRLSDGLGKASLVPSIDGGSPPPSEIYTQVKITKLR
jgi:tetrahydromethanopterin S-methyltransferase subunit F